MFDINFRLVDDFDNLREMSAKYFDSDWKHITGFFQVVIGNGWEGSWYHNEPLYDGETGPELLEDWFDVFLSVISILMKSNYVAILEIEKGNRWIEFTRKDEVVWVKVAVDSSKGGSPLLVTEPRNTFCYEEEKTCVVQWMYFYNLIMTKLNSFLQEIEELNSELLETEIIKGIITKNNSLMYFEGNIQK